MIGDGEEGDDEVGGDGRVVSESVEVDVSG